MYFLAEAGMMLLNELHERKARNAAGKTAKRLQEKLR